MGRISGARKRRASAPIWAGLLIGAGAWSAHLLVSFFLVDTVCSPLVAGGDAAAGQGAVRTALGVTSALLALLAVGGALYSRRSANLASRRDEAERSESYGGALGPVILALDWFFVVLIVFESVPLLMIGCGLG